MKRKLHFRILLGLLFLFLVQPFNSCKKVDLQRSPFFKTVQVKDVATTSATFEGKIIELGEGAIAQFGFVCSTSDNPTINNQVVLVSGSAALNMTYSATITGLSANTSYYVRSFIKSGDEAVYPEKSLTFTTQNASGNWLHYDNGANFDGIGLNSGGDFDVAIRFTPADIAAYNGWKITKIKFFPKLGAPVNYSVEILSGFTVPNLDIYQAVPNPAINQWNEVTLNTPYTINSSTDLWVGYWVQNQPALAYPVGCDAGPAVAGKGDLISIDGLATWFSLSTEAPTLNYNFNIQVYIVNQSGIEKQLLVEEKPAPVRIPYAAGKSGQISYGSFNQSLIK